MSEGGDVLPRVHMHPREHETSPGHNNDIQQEERLSQAASSAESERHW